MVAAVETAGDSFQVGKATTLFEGSFRGGMFGIGIGGFILSDYAVAPDGERYVMFPDTEQTSANTHVTLVFNWFEELLKTLPVTN
jgi:hypothetical protein